MKRLITAMVCGGLLSATAVSAAPLSGQFRLTGETEADVRVGSDYIDFGDADGTFGPPTGDFQTSTAEDSFSFLAGTTGTIKDLFAVPVGAPVMVDEFVEFDNAMAWNFTLTQIFPGSASAAECGPPSASGDECTPPGSPFTLFNLSPTRSIVALSVEGFVDNGLGEISDFTGTFTSQLDDMSLEMALADIMDDEIGFVQSSWSGEFTVTPRDTPPVPEPASLALMGLALSGMGIAIRRRRK